MENKICVDTDIIIDVLRGQKEALEFIRSHEAGSELCMTMMTLFELYVGAIRSNRKGRIESVDDLRQRFVLLELSADAVKEAAQIHVSLAQKGTMVDYKDVLIAATTMVNGCTFKTRNTRHFARIEGLRLA